VGDGEDGARVLRQVPLEPQHALGVEVVGRLVEQQQVGRLEQQLAQRDATALATGQVHDGSSGGGQRSASIACSILLSSSHASAASIWSSSGCCSSMIFSKSASGAPIFSLSSSYRSITSRMPLTPSSTLPLTVLVSSSTGSCMSMPTL
jgi:hypothetical protein